MRGNLPAAMPGSIRLFVPAPLAAGVVIDATPGQAHYLATVMRRGPGDPVHLFNGADGEWAARIERLGRGTAVLHVGAQLRPQAPEPDLWLVFALLKRDATDLLIRQGTELGVAAFRPVITARTNAARTNPERLATIATEAAEQSERLTLPALHPPCSLAELLAGWPADRKLFAALERSPAAPPPAAAGPAALLVGPEGGFTEAELDLLRARPFVTAVGLGPRILRAETAALAGLALLQASRHD
jgi:16S rRNA (uracil1498-N3)-methyltransferase